MLSQAERDDLNQQYMPRLAVPNADDYLERAAARSAAARSRLGGLIDVAFGDTPGQTLDIFPAAHDKAPVHVFVHGGYWRALDKSFYSEMAEPLVAAGATVVLTNYDLCPAVRVTEIVAQTRRAIGWVHANIGRHGGDAARIHISGHSAGAHLVAMLLATDWPALELPSNVIKSATAISGLYDLRRHRDTDVQAEIHLSEDETTTLSPLLLPPKAHCPVLVGVGGGETDLFQWQSLAYAAHLRFNRVPADVMQLGQDNHFDVTERLANAADPLTAALIAGLAR
ncbi:MAG: alpha/beta hydrolase [Hyphomicrobiaceae bacterium]|nr:alpha/beta hydrolase [Hyphomicrobiaceae bacterium]